LGYPYGFLDIPKTSGSKDNNLRYPAFGHISDLSLRYPKTHSNRAKGLKARIGADGTLS
jgi:hypothetical protein